MRRKFKPLKIPVEELERKRMELKKKRGARLQIVHRRKPRDNVHLRIPAKNIDEPSFAQTVWRYIFGKSCFDLYGVKGTITLKDGRRVQRNALMLPKKLKQTVAELGWDLQRIKWYGLQEIRARKARVWILKFREYLIAHEMSEADLPLEVLAKRTQQIINRLAH